MTEVKYRGLADSGVWVETWDSGGLQETHPLPHRLKHSPDGFSWGYGGSGPAELARCLLVDALTRYGETEETAIVKVDDGVVYHKFKDAVFARIPMSENWWMPLEYVKGWLTAHGLLNEGRA